MIAQEKTYDVRLTEPLDMTIAVDWDVTNKINWPRREKTCLRWLANNKCADQPAHPRSLFSALLIRFL